MMRDYQSLSHTSWDCKYYVGYIPKKRKKRRPAANAAPRWPRARRSRRRCASSTVRKRIEQRLLPGHWEGDFIKGSYNRSAVETVVERKTRFVILCRMDGCTAQDALGHRKNRAQGRRLGRPCMP